MEFRVVASFSVIDHFSFFSLPPRFDVGPRRPKTPGHAIAKSIHQDIFFYNVVIFFRVLFSRVVISPGSPLDNVLGKDFT